MLLNPFRLHSPMSLSDAARLYHDLTDVKLLAGGTFLLNSLKVLKKRELKTPDNIISLRRVTELRGIALHGNELRIGAMTTINEMFESPLIAAHSPVLKTACQDLAVNPIRNMATIGGNLTCRYTWAELGTVMLALDAQLHFVDCDQQVHKLSAEDFFKAGARSNKILTHVSIQLKKSFKSVYTRISKNSPVDIPLLAVCIGGIYENGRLTDSRVAVNNTVAFAQRDNQLESFLNSPSANPALAEQAVKNVNTTIYENGNEYQTHMFTVSIKKAIAQIMDTV